MWGAVVIYRVCVSETEMRKKKKTKPTMCNFMSLSFPHVPACTSASAQVINASV